MRTLPAAKLVAELVPIARQGLLQAGVAAAEADGLLDIISARAASGQTGAAAPADARRGRPNLASPSYRVRAHMSQPASGTG
jgi:hypothetical protein